MSGDRQGGYWQRRYGSHPLHALCMIASLALATYAGIKLLQGRTLAVVIWFVAAAVLHDLVLLPLYGLIDRGLLRVRGIRGQRLPQAPWINYLRVPLVLSVLLLVVFLPDIAGLAEHRYEGTTAMTTDGYLARWLLVTAGLFAASAVVYAAALGRAVRRRGAARRSSG